MNAIAPAHDACDLSTPPTAEDRDNDERCRIALVTVYARQTAAGQRIDRTAALREVQALVTSNRLPPLLVLPEDIQCSRCGCRPLRRRNMALWQLEPVPLCSKCGRTTGKGRDWCSRPVPTTLDTIGRRVTHVKYALGLTTIQLARLVGASDSTILMIESGRRKPSAAVLPRLAAALGVSEKWLLTGEENATSLLPG